MKPSLLTGTSHSSRIAPGSRPSIDRTEVRDAAPAHIQPARTSALPSYQGTLGKTVTRRLHRKLAAAYMGVSLSWLDKSRLRGDGPTFLQVGSRVIYDVQDLETYLASCRRQSTSETR